MRAAPPSAIPPLLGRGYRVEAPHSESGGGFLCIFRGNGDLVRTVQLYEPQLSEWGNSFCAYLKKLSWEEDRIRVQDETGRLFLVNPESGSFKQTGLTIGGQIRNWIKDNELNRACDVLWSRPDVEFSLRDQIEIFQRAGRPETRLLAGAQWQLGFPHESLQWCGPAAFEHGPIPHFDWARRCLEGRPLGPFRQELRQVYQALDLAAFCFSSEAVSGLVSLTRRLQWLADDPYLATARECAEHIVYCAQNPRSYETSNFETTQRMARWVMAVVGVTPEDS